MVITCNKTYPLRKASAVLQAAFLALGLQSKNVQNIAIYIVRNILSSYDKNIQKADLNESQKQVVALANTAVEEINRARIEKHRITVERGKTVEDPKLLKPFDKECSPWQILDWTLLDTLTRTHPNIGINP